VIDSAVPGFHYRPRFRSRSLMPGAHRSSVEGSGLMARSLVPLVAARDARRIDLQASLRDPFGNWWVREFRQRSTVRVIVALDMSASLAAASAREGPTPAETALAFSRAAARSATGGGDSFGLLPFGATLIEPLALAPTRIGAATKAALAAVAAAGWQADSARAIQDVPLRLPAGASLVFIVSDFRLPPEHLDSALAQMPSHDVVPVWLRPPDVPGNHNEPALVDWRDAESGRLRTLWLRPTLRRRIQQAQQGHEMAIQGCFERHQCLPLRMGGRFDADRVSAYFAGRS
jgi:uncharacterized protein (DUF58 family)